MPDEKYTLITGGSKGLRLCIAHSCARRGMNLLMISLPGEALIIPGIMNKFSWLQMRILRPTLIREAIAE